MKRLCSLLRKTGIDVADCAGKPSRVRDVLRQGLPLHPGSVVKGRAIEHLFVAAQREVEMRGERPLARERSLGVDLVKAGKGRIRRGFHQHWCRAIWNAEHLFVAQPEYNIRKGATSGVESIHKTDLVQSNRGDHMIELPR